MSTVSFFFFWPELPSSAVGVARLNDTIDHGGTIIGASTTVRANSSGMARLNDPVNCNIHGAQTITSASTTVKANASGVARVGDSISCGAVISTGSPNVNAGG
jgi:uncharacterized Zn-binding protein involved in type VI secretion